MEEDKMSIVKRLQSLNLAEDAMIHLTYEEGADVFVHNETEVEDAINETSVIYEFASLVAQTKLDVRNRWSGNILEHLRNESYLDDYERGTFDFENFIAETIRDNFYDVDLIEYSTEKYDYKRGFTTLTAEVDIPFANFVQVDPNVTGWKVSVETENGTLTFDA
jgi:hypothetical protein